jgi:phospholipid/cholesterol/gamma-HCH transport system substrate-binding protein
MENRAYALAAGLFTLLLGIGVIATAMWFSGKAVENDEYVLVSRYPVSGLNQQAPVRYRGVTVGKVVDIGFEQQDTRAQGEQTQGPRAILVKILVQTGTPLTEGTYAKLGSQGVTGLSYVMLDDDGKKPAPLTSQTGEPPRIAVRPSFMDSLSTSGEEMIANINLVAQRVNTLLSDDNQKQLVGTLRSLDQATGKIASVAVAIEPTVKALPSVINDTSIALKRADSLLANLNQRVESFDRAAKSAELFGNSGTALSEAMLTESVPRLNVLLEDVQRSSRGLERLLSEINEQPQSLIFGRNATPPGPGEPGFSAQRGTK